jgi:hypothetical protein
LREGSADIEIGVASEMGPEVRLQTCSGTASWARSGVGHPLAALRRVSAERYCAYEHVSASPRGDRASPLDAALAERGLVRKVVAVVPGFPGALAVVRTSDLVAMVPRSFLTTAGAPRKDGSASGIHLFELPIATDPIIVSLMWHPAWSWTRRIAGCATRCARSAPDGAHGPGAKASRLNPFPESTHATARHPSCGHHLFRLRRFQGLLRGLLGLRVIAEHYREARATRGSWTWACPMAPRSSCSPSRLRRPVPRVPRPAACGICHLRWPTSRPARLSWRPRGGRGRDPRG